MLIRIKNKYLRYPVYGILLLVIFCLGYFGVNRVLSSGRAVKLKKLELDKPIAASLDGNLRIATFNIAHGRGIAKSNWQTGEKEEHVERLKRIAGLIEKENLDVVVLNEVDLCSVWTGYVNQAEVIAREARFTFMVELCNIDMALPFVSVRFGSAVISHYPVQKAELVSLPGYSTLENIFAGHKDGVVCTINLPDGGSFRLMALHLEHRSELTRVNCVDRIMEVQKASSLPLVVAGDLNSTPVDFPCATLDESGWTAVSLLLDGKVFQTLPAGSPKSEDFTFPSTSPRSVIDWILVPREWKIISKAVIGTPAGEHLSDHNAVVMEVKLN